MLTAPWPAPTLATRSRPRRSRRTTLAIALGTIATAISLPLGNDAPLAVALLFLISAPLELIWRRHRVPFRRFALRTDLAYAVATPALQAVGLVAAVIVGVLSFAWAPALLLRPIVTHLPTTARVLLGFALFDLAIYWTHRLEHEVPLLWRFHAVHHSTLHLDWVSGFRSHPLDGVAGAPVFVALLAAGFGAEVTGGLAVARFVVGLWAHLNVRWRLRPLRRLVLTPDFHHWHHSTDPIGRHSNYSTFLPVWDVLFGTWFMPSDRRPEHYGIDGPMPVGIVGQLLQPFQGLPRFRRRAVG